MKKSRMIGLFLALLILPTFILASSSTNFQANEFENYSLNNREWTIVASYPIPEGAAGLAYDGTYLYCGIYGANGGRIYQIDPSNGNYSLLFTGPQGDAFGLTYDGSYLWTTDHPGSSSIPAVAMQLDMSGNLISEFNLPAHYMSGIAYDDGDFWVAAYYEPEAVIYKVDTLGTIITQFDAPDDQPWDLCIEHGDLWMADYYGDALYKINASNGTLLETHPSEHSDPAGIVFDGTYLWYCDNGSGYDQDLLYKVDLGGAGTPAINIPNTNYPFGTVTVGDSASWNCYVYSVGTSNLEVTDVTITGTNASDVSYDLDLPVTIIPGANIVIPFKYLPTETGLLNCIATVSSSDPLTPEVEITMTGEAVNPGPSIFVPESTHNYGLVRLNALTRWFMEIENSGDETLIISSIYSDDDCFFVDQDVSFPINIGVLGSKMVGIWFSPDQPTSYDATISIESNSVDKSIFEVSVTGSSNDVDYPIGYTLWNYMINVSWDNSPKAIDYISDINGDGVDDVIVCSEDYFIRCFNGNSSGTADVLWDFEIYSGYVYSYRGLDIIEDINGDGYQDVIVGTAGGDRSIRAISGKDGTSIWIHDTHEYGGGGWVYQVNCKFDYNGDGHTDVLAATGDDADDIGPKRVYCLDALTGLSIWERPLGGPVFSVIGIEDCTGDGQPDVLAGASNENESIGYAYGINGATGGTIWTFTTTSSSVWALEQIDDVNDDEVSDVIIGDFSGFYYILNPVNGADIYSGGVGSAIILQLIKLDDVNGDGFSDIAVAHSTNSNVQVINGSTGSILWYHSVADQPWNASRIGDVSGDGINDLVVGTLYANNYAYFLNGVDGSELHSINFGTPVDAIGSIPDIVGDNSMEMVAGGRNGAVYCYSGGLNTVVSVDDEPNISNSILTQNFPNPFSKSTTIQFSKPAGCTAHTIIKVYNIIGQLINETVLDPMQNSFTWDGTDLQGNSVSSGIYFYKVQSGSYNVTSKMIYMK